MYVYIDTHLIIPDSSGCLYTLSWIDLPVNQIQIMLIELTQKLSWLDPFNAETVRVVFSHSIGEAPYVTLPYKHAHYFTFHRRLPSTWSRGHNAKCARFIYSRAMLLVAFKWTGSDRDCIDIILYTSCATACNAGRSVCAPYFLYNVNAGSSNAVRKSTRDACKRHTREATRNLSMRAR